MREYYAVSLALYSIHICSLNCVRSHFHAVNHDLNWRNNIEWVLYLIDICSLNFFSLRAHYYILFLSSLFSCSWDYHDWVQSCSVSCWTTQDYGELTGKISTFSLGQGSLCDRSFIMLSHGLRPKECYDVESWFEATGVLWCWVMVWGHLPLWGVIFSKNIPLCGLKATKHPGPTEMLPGGLHWYGCWLVNCPLSIWVVGIFTMKFTSHLLAWSIELFHYQSQRLSGRLAN